MSQSDLAEKVGITFQQIQKYEKGTNRIGSSRMSQIAGALGVQPPYFFDDPLANAGGDMEDFNTFIGSRDGVLLMQAFVKIKDKTLRRTIAQLVADLED
jgi:transcriptional regulator with XRE-family HTH domain